MNPFRKLRRLRLYLSLRRLLLLLLLLQRRKRGGETGTCRRESSGSKEEVKATEVPKEEAKKPENPRHRKQLKTKPKKRLLQYLPLLKLSGASCRRRSARPPTKRETTPRAAVVAEETAPRAEKRSAKATAKPKKKEPAKRVQTVKRETPDKPAPAKPARPVRRERRSIAELSLPITERITTPDPVAPPEPVRRKPLTTSDGRPVRPQRGSYVGRDRDIPVSDRRRPARAAARQTRDERRSSPTPIPARLPIASKRLAGRDRDANRRQFLSCPLNLLSLKLRRLPSRDVKENAEGSVIRNIATGKCVASSGSDG